MVQKVVLGKRPPFIRRDIKLVMPDGEPGNIRVDYRYFTRRELADYVDKLIEEANAMLQAANAELEKAAVATPAPAPATKRTSKAAQAAATVATPAPAPLYSERKSADEAIGATSKQLLDVIVGWDLGVPLTIATLDQLCDEFPGAAAAISGGLRKAVNEGHSGN